MVVKASYSVHRSGKSRSVLQDHVRYLGRDSALLDAEPRRFYDAREQDVDAKQLVREWEQDRHHFRFIISPEYGHQIDRQPRGLTAYVRELMEQVQRDLDTKLEWAAINHHNTDDRHAHVLVRGKRDDGRELGLPRDYIKYGMR